MFPDPVTIYAAAKSGELPNTTLDLDMSGYKTTYSPNGATYALDGGTALPTKMVISHQQIGKGTAVRDRHYLRLETPSEDGEVIGSHAPAVLYVVADVPRNFKHDDTMANLVLNMIGVLAGYDASLTSSADKPDLTNFVDRWLRGES
jgi:hypothetical protein